MASEVESLCELFDRGISLHHDIETSEKPSSTQIIQEKVEAAQKCFIKSTEMVNSLGLFSTNEQLEEVPTSEIKYFLLAAFLGDLHMRLMGPDRLTDISTAKIYFVNFLRRCTDYGIMAKVLEFLSDLDVSNYLSEKSPEVDSKEASLKALAMTRQEKIRRYKEQKEQQHRIKVLKDLLSSDKVDREQIERDYFISLVKLWITKAIEQLSSIEDELEILKHMQNMKTDGDKGKQRQQPPAEPMKPVVITRESIQAKVFGAGYPSLPTMTPEEYLEKEIREGKVVLEYAKDKKEASHEGEDNSEDAEEDDPEKLRKARNWDDWKDENRRGWGNRENMG